MNEKYSPGMSAICGSDQMIGSIANQALQKNVAYGEKISPQPRMAEAFDDLERAVNILADVALHIAARTECLQRPRHPEPVGRPETGQIRAAAGQLVNQVETMTERVRSITSGMQDTLQRLEV